MLPFSHPQMDLSFAHYIPCIWLKIGSLSIVPPSLSVILWNDMNKSRSLHTEVLSVFKDDTGVCVVLSSDCPHCFLM